MKTSSAKKTSASGIEWTPANVVTMVRICLIPLFIVLMLAPWASALFTVEVAANVQAVCALVAFALISLTDGIDGYLARSRNEVTVFGKFMDPIADKVLVVSAMIVLVQLGSLPSWIPIVIIARELLVSGLRMLVASAGVVVAASMIGKAKTATTMVALCLFILMDAPMVDAMEPWFGIVAWSFMLAAVVLTVLSMVDYFMKSWPLLVNSGNHSASEPASDAPDCHASVLADSNALASQVVARARAKGVRLAAAESCTGGMVAAALTSVPGSSECTLGGVVSYDPKVKRDILGVSDQVMEGEGVVSSATARAMARGARMQLGADLVVSTTGVAGPAGGTDEVPVGTVWFAVADENGCDAEMRQFEGNRQEVRCQATAHALALLLARMS